MIVVPKNDPPVSNPSPADFFENDSIIFNMSILERQATGLRPVIRFGNLGCIFNAIRRKKWQGLLG